MLIRKATPKDFEKLKLLRREFYKVDCKYDKGLDPRWAQHGLPAKLASILRSKRDICFIAIEDNEFIGYAHASVDKNPPFFKNKYIGHLANLYVKKKFRRKGVAKKLIDHVMKWFKTKKVKEYGLYVFERNRQALPLYKNYGFKEYIKFLKK